MTSFTARDIGFRSFGSVILNARQKTLEPQDALVFEPVDDPAENARLLKEAWRNGSQDNVFFIRTVWQLQRSTLLRAGLLHAGDILLGFVAPGLVKPLLDNLDSPSKSLGYAIAIALAPMCSTFLNTHFDITSRLLGFRVCGGYTCWLFEKILRLSPCSLVQYGHGRLANIIQVDTSRLQHSFFFIFYLFSMPLVLVVSLAMLFGMLGWACLMPVFITFLTYKFNQILTKQLMILGAGLNRARDQRVKLLTEVLHAVRLCKMLSWEAQVQGLVEEKREAELKLVNHFKSWQTVLGLLFGGSMTAITQLATFSVYILLGGELTAGVVFSSLATFDLLQVPMNMLPITVQYFVQTLVSVRRIQAVLSAEEWGGGGYERNPLGSPSLRLEETRFRWPEGELDSDDEAVGGFGRQAEERRRCCARFRRRRAEPPLLDAEAPATQMTAARPSQLSVPLLTLLEGKLTMVTGSVGAGKSTLLSAMLGEVPQLSGRTALAGSVAYCAQQPWILHGTVQDNITFGRSYREDKFRNTVEVCALLTDLMQLHSGAETIIGERGINVSGGQKARISLARAVYSDASTFLLDDPLSAVDAHVAQHLMEQCLGKEGYLSKKTRLLVSHQTQFAPQADYVIHMKDGRIVAMGSPGELQDLLHEETPATAAARSEAPTSPPPPLEFERAFSAEVKDEMEVEERAEDVEEGSLSVKVWCAFLRAMRLGVSFMVVLLNVYSTAGYLLSALWLGHWPEVRERFSVGDALGIYAAVAVSILVFTLFRILIFQFSSMRLARQLHRQALWAVLRAPMAWLDTTPSGRIVNRFSNDMQKVDLELQNAMQNMLRSSCDLSASILVVCVVLPLVFLFFLPALVAYYFVQKIYRKAAREIQRLASKSKSPIYQGVDEAIVGVATIRAYEKQGFFLSQHERRVIRSLRLDFTQSGCQKWLTLRLKLLGCLVSSVVALLVVLHEFLGPLGRQLSGPAAGVALRYAQQLGNAMESILSNLTMAEQSLVAVERLTAYTNFENEGALELPGQSFALTKGCLRFENVEMRYREELPLVLKGLSFELPGGTSLGVVGRTGAGKSSLLQALFRMCPLESGAVLLDGVDISSVGLTQLRRALAIIPQDPVGFSGTVRFNLDPFGELSDAQLWEELDKVQLKAHFQAKEEGLGYLISAGGQNLSMGQRQLLCCARALLRKTKMLVLDEATASVDYTTDQVIQKILQTEVRTKQLTTITIAHRIDTVLGGDRVLVLSDGKVAEFGRTQELAKDPKSVFYTFLSSKDKEEH